MDTLTSERALAAFEAAWQRAEKAYRLCEINAESCLQAHLFAALRDELPAATIYCDARLVFPDRTRQYVDMLVCSGETVLALVELKYKPNVGLHRCGAGSDIKKLLQFRGRRSKADRIELEITRFRGVKAGESKSLRLTNAAALIFACIARADPHQSTSDKIATRRYMAKTYVPTIGDRQSRRAFPRRLTMLIGTTEREMQNSTLTIKGRVTGDA